MDSVRLTLLTRAYCHLCDEMRDELVALVGPGNALIEQVDVDSDPALAARWGDLVPVLLMGERELCHYKLDRTAVAKALSHAQSVSP